MRPAEIFNKLRQVMSCNLTDRAISFKRQSVKHVCPIDVGMLRIVAYILMLSCLILPACSSETKDPVSYSDPADTIRVAVGDQFKIVLESNPTTGYSWQFRQSIDSTFLKLVVAKYVAKPNPEKLMGRGGHDHWTFEAKAQGSTSVSLHYLRPWDSTSVERTLDFSIEIAQE